MVLEPNEIFLENDMDIFRVKHLIRSYKHMPNPDITYDVHEYVLVQHVKKYPSTGDRKAMTVSWNGIIFIKYISDGCQFVLSDSTWIERMFQIKFKEELGLC